MRDDFVRQIERIMADYAGGECVYVPSGRMALYLGLKVWLPAGAKVLMSPLDDDVVFFTVIAAGMTPVMAPVSGRSGNIDAYRISDRTWQNVDAIMTMNHHGIPDQMDALRAKCDEHGLFLLEDVAHAFGVTYGGKPLGTFGDASGFSFSKHLGRHGGALCFRDSGKIAAVREAYRAAITPRALGKRFEDAARPVVRRAADLLRARRALKAMLRARSKKIRGDQPRMPLRAALLRAARTNARIEAFDPWVLVDGRESRIEQKSEDLAALLSAIREYLSDKSPWLKGVEKLVNVAGASPIAIQMKDQPLMRVPFLIENRDEIRNKLQDNGFSVPYVYYPPLDDYYGNEFCIPSSDGDAARWWSMRVLPIKPLAADRFLENMRGLDLQLRPSAPQ